MLKKFFAGLQEQRMFSFLIGRRLEERIHGYSERYTMVYVVYVLLKNNFYIFCFLNKTSGHILSGAYPVFIVNTLWSFYHYNTGNRLKILLKSACTFEIFNE